ncbi:hypothetical protein [Emergencia sp.]
MCDDKKEKKNNSKVKRFSEKAINKKPLDFTNLKLNSENQDNDKEGDKNK